jgi:CBS-domain-containing membrane protein
MKIRDCMKKNVYAIPATASVRDAVAQFADKHIGLLPVLDPENHLLGVVGLKDLLHLALPAGFFLLHDIDFIGDFGAVEKYLPSPADLAQPITAIMRQATLVKEDSGLMRAYALMLQHDLHDLPVVDQQGRLIGIASRVDIGIAVLSGWL